MHGKIQLELRELAERVDTETAARSVCLPREYTYKSLPLALIDAVFSIGVKYRATENTVERFCRNQSPAWSRFRPEVGPEHPVSQFLDTVANLKAEEVAERIYGNRQRTSAVNGILKAEAVTRCARVLVSHGIDCFADAWKLQHNATLENEFRKVPGQGSGISFSYLKMLCGDDDGIKPDRHITRFMARHAIADVQQLRAVAAELRISARMLDYAIWQKMSGSAA
jgi:endonuclease III